MPLPGLKQRGARAGAAPCILSEAVKTLDGKCSGKMAWGMSVSLPRTCLWGCVSSHSAEREPSAHVGGGLDQAPA